MQNVIHPPSPLFAREKIVDYFAFEGHKQISGWLSSHTLAFLYYLNQFHYEQGIEGDIAEIGVFQGRFFIALCLMMNTGEKAVAIDVFDEQHLNLDKSGVGDYEIFSKNIKRVLGGSQFICIIKSDSLKVKSQQLLDFTVGRGVRLFSIDGCHTVEHTENDLLLAEQSLASGGVIILDDFENPDWPGVKQGVERFLGRVSTMVPFAVAYNKLYFTTTSHVAKYCGYVEKIIANSMDNISFERVAGFDVMRALLPSVESVFSDSFEQYIDLSTHGNPEKYLRTGWSTPEPWGVWSQADLADLVVKAGSVHNGLIIAMSFHAFVAKEHPSVQINIVINGVKADSICFAYGQDYQNWIYRLPVSEITNGMLHIIFSINNPISPLELGLSTDERKLGIGLRNIRLTGNDNGSK